MPVSITSFVSTYVQHALHTDCYNGSLELTVHASYMNELTHHGPTINGRKYKTYSSMIPCSYMKEVYALF